MAKASSDVLLGVGIVTVSSGVVAGVGTLFVPAPVPEAWPWMAASAALHYVYQLTLVLAYRLGDLSQVYPIARGLAPAIVGVLAVWGAGESLSDGQAAGLVLVTIAIASLARVPRGTTGGSSVVAVSLLTGMWIGAYTFVDGRGVRIGGWSYIAWTLFLDAIPMTLTAIALRRRRVLTFLRTDGVRGVGAGVMGVVGYAIVLWALGRGAMAPVAALRETSVVMAAWMGSRLLGEPFGRRRMVAAGGVVAGVVLLQAAR